VAYDVKSFGATGDGKTIDTPAINRAIDAAAAAGGGVVHFPAGLYMCYSIHLKSNITIQFDPGCTVQAAETTATAGYDAPEPNQWSAYQDFGHSHWHNGLFWGENLTNVTIEGPGLIDGRGLRDANGPTGPSTTGRRGSDVGGGAATQPGARGAGGGGRGAAGARRGVAAGAATQPLAGARGARGGRGGGGGGGDALRGGIGDKSFSMRQCRNVTFRDFSIIYGGHFGFLLTGVDNLTLDNIRIDTNRDGMDIDCCRNVRVSNCTVNSPWDDAIVLKSCYALGHVQDTENVTITNCFVTAAFEQGSLLDGTFKRIADDPGYRGGGTGRIKFGTESNGGFKNISISNCTFDTCQGLALETVDGGVIEDVSISNITMRNIGSLPIFIRLGNRARGPAGTPVGAIRRVNISNIVAINSASRYACEICGIPGHDIQDVRISNVRITYPGKGTVDDAWTDVPEVENGYPEPSMFGTIPAYGFYIRHVSNITLSDIDMTFTSPEARPPFVLDSVKGADFYNIKAPKGSLGWNFSLLNVTDFSAREVKGMPDKELAVAKSEQF
jgi:polygalacturonase